MFENAEASPLTAVVKTLRKQEAADQRKFEWFFVPEYPKDLDVTAAATYYIAEIYYEFSDALLTSERPEGLSEAEKLDYELVIEEEAYPFEEQAIEVHEKNFEMLAGGIFNPWVTQSLDRLTVLMPGRYARNEISGGFMGSIDSYPYRMPIAPPPTHTPVWVTPISPPQVWSGGHSSSWPGSGWASVPTSKSLGSRPSSRSRTPPPTRCPW